MNPFVPSHLQRGLILRRLKRRERGFLDLV